VKNILIVFGTRPEIIKLAPLISELKSFCNLTTLHTGQHRDLAYPLFKLFEIQPDIDLDVMEEGQDLFALTGKLLPLLKSSMMEVKPDYVIVQGDTTSSYLAALSSFYLQIPVLHVEAGLRSHSIREPFPEELNRRQISGIASYHFAATELNKLNLLNEGIDEKRIVVTGNTIVDAMRSVTKHHTNSNGRPQILNGYQGTKQNALLTVHRRENHGQTFHDILNAIEKLLELFPDLSIILPVHPNPNIQKVIRDHNISSPRFITIPPVTYDDFIEIIQFSDFILTDSGGLQEEGAALGKKIFVLRNKTERMELIDSELGELVGTDPTKIVDCVSSYLRSGYKVDPKDIYGDGKAAERIREFILDQL